MNSLFTKGLIIIIVMGTIGNAQNHSDPLYLAQVSKNGKFGFINHEGSEVIPCKYDGILLLQNGYFQEGYVGVNLGGTNEYFETTGGKWGFLDITGKVSVPIVYEEIRPFSEGYAGVKLNGKWGFVDSSGNMTIEPRFNEIQPFTNGTAIVCYEMNHFLISNNGQKVMDFGRVEKVKPLGKAHFGVKKNEKWQIKDRSGKSINSSTYDELAWQEGVGFLIQQFIGEDSYGPVYQSGVLNTKGGEIIPVSFVISEEMFQDGLAIFEAPDPNDPYRFDRVKGVIDTLGNIIHDAQYSAIENWGRTGKVTIAGKYTDSLHGEPTYLRTEKFGALHKSGKVSIPFEYSRLRPVFNSKTKFTDKFIATIGKIWRFQFFEVDSASGAILNSEKLPNYGVINTEGKIVIPFEYSNLKIAGDGIYLAESLKFDKVGVINEENETLIPFQRNPIMVLCTGIFYEEIQENTFRVFNLRNETLFKLSGHELLSLEQPTHLVMVKEIKSSKFGIIDLTGEIIAPPIYDNIYLFQEISSI